MRMFVSYDKVQGISMGGAICEFDTKKRIQPYNQIATHNYEYKDPA